MSLEYILAPLRQVEPAQLRRVVAYLKGRQGEWEAAGKCLDRAVDCLCPKDQPGPKAQLDFDKAYGDTTIPLGSRR